MHAAVLPTLEDDGSISEYLDFLECPSRDMNMHLGRVGADRIDVFRASFAAPWSDAPFDD